ncbi:hypothetical protein [Methylococcus capsulatus]|uniref:hypothetical protein n=1 Tax=Methylococcus capsulatus TaxID=414 RepID=UPI001C532457|nr:hypothetical protein [Methylococcus capsulatus]QXP86379.1 hypothetical protein KW112_08045 [Methylococcus capsulatus]QXP93952.1 hypothetical protein KW113_01595 [Methylococcus capsulatus]UQN11322.1 hypothetical protein M3M30_09790 [Methylococcus capsulatus]
MNARTYANEEQYHQWFIDNITEWTINQKTSRLLIIGHEISLFGGSVKGGLGSADLLAVDEDGLLWLIEAKISSSAEFGTVWNQLLRYRDSMQRNNKWPALERQMLKFLCRKEKVEPHNTTIDKPKSLKKTISTWLAYIGRTDIDANTFYNNISEQMRNGTFGLVVLADSDVQIAREKADKYEHGGPKAYLVAQPDHSGHILKCVYYSHAGQSIFRPQERTEFYDRSYCKCTEYNLKEFLAPQLRSLVDEVIYPNLHILSWNGRPHLIRNKSIAIALNFKSGEGETIPVRIIDVGWSDADASRVSSTNRVPGTYGLKVNFRAVDLEKIVCIDEALRIVRRWATELYKIGWRGRGAGSRIHDTPLTVDQYKKFAKEFEYSPKADIKDFTKGDEVERQALESFFNPLMKIKDEIEMICSKSD